MDCLNGDGLVLQTIGLTSSTSPGVIISVGDIMMASPATLTSMPRFWHSSPKIAPTPENIIGHQTDLYFQKQIQADLS
jgi:hypothetical protein